jgi:peptidoglycan/LPS O-acetylase OafA/YrhL
MSHIFVLWVCNQFLRVVLHRPEGIADGISTPQLSVLSALLWEGIAVAGTILVSTQVFKYVENPCRLKSKELARRFMPANRGLVRAGVVQNRDLAQYGK